MISKAWKFYVKEEDLNYTYTTKIYSYVFPKLQKIKSNLNTILYNNFPADVINSCLISDLRRGNQGFNLNFTIHFLIYFFNEIKKENTKNEELVEDLKEYLVSVDNKNLKADDLKPDYTIKLLPYMQHYIHKCQEQLNSLLDAYFKEDFLEITLYAKKRWYHRGFNYSFMLDFLCEYFSLYLNPIDIESVIVSFMKEFFINIENLIIREDTND